MTRPDGFRLRQHRISPNGKPYEQWLSPDDYTKWRVACAVCQSRIRAKDRGLPFDIDAEYLMSIYPSDGLCPALGVPLVWGTGRINDDSPALDRKVPSLGYVRGNVAFISDKANRIKTDATTEEVLRVAKYLKDMNYS